MSIKKWCGFTLGPLALFFLLCITVIVLIDPFQAYHLAGESLPPVDKTSQVYSNPGIARNYTYDSAIVGTSVTENFRPSYMNTVWEGSSLNYVPLPAPFIIMPFSLKLHSGPMYCGVLYMVLTSILLLVKVMQLPMLCRNICIPTLILMTLPTGLIKVSGAPLFRNA